MAEAGKAVFEVYLFRTQQGAIHTLVSHPSCGERHHRLALPFDALTARALLHRLGSSRGATAELSAEEQAALCALAGVDAAATPGMELLLPVVGRRLLKALFPTAKTRDEDLRGAFEGALAESFQAGVPLRLQLRFDSGAVGAASLPWELLADESGPLVASGRLRFSRYVTFGEPTRELAVADRLDVLIVSPRPQSLAWLDPDAEAQAVADALQGLGARAPLRVERLSPPTFAELVRAVNRRPFHILHFDGHGGYVRRCPRCDLLQPAEKSECDCHEPLGAAEPHGCLAFERADDTSQKHLVQADELGAVLAAGRIHLCVISACQSTTLLGASVFNSVGPRLIRAGVPAVVGMQFPVPANEAVTFAEEFYAGVARAESVAAAADAARRLLYAGGHWYIPTTWLRKEDGEGMLFRFHEGERVRARRTWEVDAQGTGVYLLPAGSGSEPPAGESLPVARPWLPLRPYGFGERALFCGRTAESNELLAAVVNPAARCTLLLGPAGVGKSSLVHAGLIPQLLGHSYAVCSLRDYTLAPVQTLRRALAASSLVRVDLTGADDLAGLAAALVRDLDRPLLLVLDEFEHLLAGSPSLLASFVTQLAAALDAHFALPVAFLIVLDVGQYGDLGLLQAQIPSIMAHPVVLKPLSLPAAKQACAHPLELGGWPLHFDARFLEQTLLPDLCAQSPDGPAALLARTVNPTHLAIVCDDLFQAAQPFCADLAPGTRFAIGPELYSERRTSTILSSFLMQKLAEHFPDPPLLEQARALLKQMVTEDGECRELPRDEIARRAGLGRDTVDQIVALLASDGLLEPRPQPDHSLRFAVAHRFLALQIRAWFDAREALLHEARDLLEQAWHSWRGKWQSAHRPAAEIALEVGDLLIGPDQLHAIHAARNLVAADGSRLAINGVQFCLLLRSAVRHHVESDYWAHEVQAEPAPRALLTEIHGGPARSTQSAQPSALSEDVQLGAAALGLPVDGREANALARAAVAGPEGQVRQTAALALAALGLQTVSESLPTLASAAPRAQGRRLAQALARMQSAGFELPALPALLTWRVRWWSGLYHLWSRRARLLVEAAGAGLGAGLGLGLWFLGSRLAQNWGNLEEMRDAFVLSAFLSPLGICAGVFIVATVFFLGAPGRGAQPVRSPPGVWAGMMAAVILIWLPFALASGSFTTAWINVLRIVQSYLLGGALLATALAAAEWLAVYVHARTALWRVLIYALAGMASGAIASALHAGFPFQTGAEPGHVPMAWSATLGLLFAAGLAGGWEAGKSAWHRLTGPEAATRAWRPGLKL